MFTIGEIVYVWLLCSFMYLFMVMPMTDNGKEAFILYLISCAFGWTIFGLVYMFGS